VSEIYSEAIGELLELSDLCASEGMFHPAKALAFRASELPREGLMATRDYIGSLVRSSEGEHRAAYEMAYGSVQRIILRVIAQRGIGACPI